MKQEIINCQAIYALKDIIAANPNLSILEREMIRFKINHMRNGKTQKQINNLPLHITKDFNNNYVTHGIKGLPCLFKQLRNIEEWFDSSFSLKEEMKSYIENMNLGMKTIQIFNFKEFTQLFKIVEIGEIEDGTVEAGKTENGYYFWIDHNTHKHHNETVVVVYSVENEHEEIKYDHFAHLFFLDYICCPKGESYD